MVEEFEQGADVTLLYRCVPSVTHGESGPEVAGNLLRRVTELRRPIGSC